MAENANSTRQQILHMLKKSVRLSAGEIAERLKITDMAVRKHLHSLERDHLIQSELVRQAMGRPTQAYFLTEEAEHLFPKNYADITLDFLNDVEELQGTEMVNRLFERREGRINEKYQQSMDGLPLDLRVAELAKLQDQKGYMVEWEYDAKSQKYFLKEFNCPIHMVANQYKQACSSELSLFRKVLNADVEQLECKAKGGERCVYAIKPRSE